MTRDAEHTPSPQSVVVRRADLEEVRDLLMERIYGSNARSPGHNARLAVEALLNAAPAPSSLAGGEVIQRALDAISDIMTEAIVDEPAGRGAGYRVCYDEPAVRTILAALSPEAPAREVNDNPLTFGMGALVVNTGKFGGDNAVFIARAKEPGEVGAYTGKSAFDRKTLQPGELVMIFPTAEQVHVVADALVGALTPRHEAPASHAFEASHSIKREGGCKVCGQDEASHEAPAEGAGEDASFWFDPRDPEVTDTNPDNILIGHYAAFDVTMIQCGDVAMFGFWFEPGDGSEFQYRYFSDRDQADAEALAIEAAIRAQPQAREEAQPVPVTIFCPQCALPHVDEDEWATTRHHKTHQCQGCGHEWRPFPFATVGVAPPSQPLAEGADADKLRTAVEALEITKSRIQTWPIDDQETCMCGSPVSGHGIGDGHSSVSQGDHAVSMLVEEIDQALAALKAEVRDRDL